ncbi:MAG: hypothetical protein QOJ16_832 [Acidobacteriota bacterium]|nr:hypothetical protein [Acidobacteriota bacterium]
MIRPAMSEAPPSSPASPSSPAGPAVNSREYWEDRFAADWAAHGGYEQSRVFMDLLVHYLPAAIFEEIAAGALSLLDCGCATGDGTAVLRERFPGSPVAGCDWSAGAIATARDRHPGIEFFTADFTTLDRPADVLLSSNCFEHLERPLSALSRLLSLARRWVLLLVPFYEGYPPHPEHVRVVHAATFPERLDGWVLESRIVIPPSPVWAGEQALLLYRPVSAEEQAAAGAALDLEREAEALRAALAATRELAAARADALGKAERQLLWHERGLAEARQEAESARAAAAERLGELGRLRAEQARLADDHQRLADGHQQLIAVHQELAARAGALTGSLAVGLVLRGWRLADRLLPDGTRRRRLLRGALSAARRAAGAGRPQAIPAISAAAPVLSPLSAAPPPEPSEPSEAPVPDPLDELRRFAETVERTGAETVVALFSGTQLREDEGQRPTQLALELARRGIPVVFVYWRWSPAERCPQDQLSQGILQIPVDAVLGSPGSLAAAFAGRRRIALFEFPYPGFFEPLAVLNGAGWITVYDAIDDWEEFHRVGQATWYEEGFERHLATAADAVFAVTPPLAERLRGLGADRVEVVPNGLRPGLEVVREARETERGEVTVGYFGHLSEAWFDWRLVTAAARLRPAWRFFLIGYGQEPEWESGLPENIVLLGKQPQSELAAWAAGWDVAIVPFRPERLAAGADPIKTYEYLALGLPVVVTAVAPPPGASGLVARVEGVAGFLAGIEEAARRRHAEGGEEERRAYAAACTWEHRVDALLAAVSGASQRIGEKRRLFAEMP